MSTVCVVVDLVLYSTKHKVGTCTNNRMCYNFITSCTKHGTVRNNDNCTPSSAHCLQFIISHGNVTVPVNIGNISGGTLQILEATHHRVCSKHAIVVYI